MSSTDEFISPGPLDEHIFPYIKLNNSQYRRRFHIDNYREFKKAFLNNDDSVKPIYKSLNDKRFTQKISDLTLLDSVIINKSNVLPKVKELYKEKIQEKKSLLELVNCAYLAQQEGEDAIKASTRFAILSETIFGSPKQTIFNDLVWKIKGDLALLPTEIKELPAYDNLMNLFLEINGQEINKLNSSNLRLNSDSEVRIIEAEDIVKFFSQKMIQAGLSDWQVKVTNKPISSFKVYVNKKLVLIPKSSVLKSRKNERVITPTVLEGLFAHEILTHVVRAVNGSKSPLLLLSHGLAGYLRGEEGLATYREQVITGAKDYAGSTMYLAIGLAYGLDRGGIKRTFREVYTILKDYFLLKYIGQKKGVKSKAFATCCRIFVISPHDNYPLIFTRDIVYREGNILVNNLLKNHSGLERFLDIGKFDPTDQRHIEDMIELGIISLSIKPSF